MVVTMKDFSAFLRIRRYKNGAHKISSWKYLAIWRPVLPVSPWAQSASFLLSSLNSLQGLLKVSSCSSTWLNPMEIDGKCQFVVDTTSNHIIPLCVGQALHKCMFPLSPSLLLWFFSYILLLHMLSTYSMFYSFFDSLSFIAIKNKKNSLSYLPQL